MGLSHRSQNHVRSPVLEPDVAMLEAVRSLALTMKASGRSAPSLKCGLITQCRSLSSPQHRLRPH